MHCLLSVRTFQGAVSECMHDSRNVAVFVNKLLPNKSRVSSSVVFCVDADVSVGPPRTLIICLKKYLYFRMKYPKKKKNNFENTSADYPVRACAGDNSTEVPLFQVPRVLIWQEIVITLSDMPRSTQLFDDGDEFVHFRVASLFWGFPDDVYERMTCTDEGLTALEVQGNLRIGHGDMGVNAHRNAMLIQGIRDTYGTVNVGNCEDMA